MNGLGDIPLNVRDQIAAAIRERAHGLASDLRNVVGGEAGVDPTDGAASADALLTLVTKTIEDGTLDGRQSETTKLARFPPGLTIRQLVNVARAVERALLDELAPHERLGAVSESWPLVTHSVRSSVLEAIAWFAERETARTAFRDPLTTLLSAELFDLTLTQEVMRAIRHHHGIAVLLFDVDDLSQLNRVHGWGAGDRLLERLGILARNFFRTHDWVARHGEDSIAVLLPETSLDQAATLAERFRETVEHRIVLMNYMTEETSAVTVSAAAVGTDLVQTELDRGQVMAEAEAAVMRAKLDGGNRVERVALLPTSVTILGAATLLGVTSRDVVKLIRTGALTASRRGRHYHIDRAAIEQYKAHR
jgi:diguanylate cyclase (GGDEF)-like protein/excisionase family DNA binding protein